MLAPQNIKRTGISRTRVRRKVIVLVLVLVLEYITKVIVLTITSHDYIFFI